MDLTTPVVASSDPVDANTSDLPVVPTDADWDDDSPLPPRRPKLFGKATWTLAGILVAAGCFTLGARLGHDSRPVAVAAAPGRGAATGSSGNRVRIRPCRHRHGSRGNRRWRHFRHGAARRRKQHLHPRQPGQRHQDHTGADRDHHGQQAWHPRRLQARGRGGRPRRRRAPMETLAAATSIGSATTGGFGQGGATSTTTPDGCQVAEGIARPAPQQLTGTRIDPQ